MGETCVLFVFINGDAGIELIIVFPMIEESFIELVPFSGDNADY